jgi:hypothetical protein
MLQDTLVLVFGGAYLTQAFFFECRSLDPGTREASRVPLAAAIIESVAD